MARSWPAMAMISRVAKPAPSSNLDSRRIARRRPRRQRTQKQIEGDKVRDHQQGHIEDGDRVGGAELSRQRWKVDLNAVPIVHDKVGRPHEVEGGDEGPEKRG